MLSLLLSRLVHHSWASSCTSDGEQVQLCGSRIVKVRLRAGERSLASAALRVLRGVMVLCWTERLKFSISGRGRSSCLAERATVFVAGQSSADRALPARWAAVVLSQRAWMRAAGGVAQIRASVRGRDRSSRPLVVTWRQVRDPSCSAHCPGETAPCDGGGYCRVSASASVGERDVTMIGRGSV